MSEQLYDKFSDLQALEKEKDAILSLFGEIKKGVEDLSKLGIKIDTAKGLKETSDAAKKLQEIETQLAETQKRLAEGQARLAEIRDRTSQQIAGESQGYKSLNNELSVNIQRQVELKQRLKEIGSDLKKLEGFAGAAKGNKEFTDQVVRLTEEQSKLKVELQSTTKFINNQVKELTAAEGSIDQMRAKLNQLNQTYDALGEGNQQSSEGQALLKQIQDFDASLKKLEGETGRFQRNVGNYQGSAKIIVDSLKDVQEEIARLQQKQQQYQNFAKQNPIGFKANRGDDNLNQVNAQLATAVKQSEALTNIVNSPQFLNVSAKAGDAIAETRMFTKTLIDLENQGLKNTEAYRQVQAQLAKLTDTIADTRAEIKALSSDTRGFDIFASSVGTVSSVFQTAASSAELFVGSNEEIQKSIQKLVAIQNISNGIRQIATDLTTRGSAANKLYAFVQGQVAIATNASATAATRLNAVLKLSGVGLLVTGIGLLIAKLVDFGGATSDAEKEMDRLNKTIDEQNRLLDKNNEKIDFNGKLRLERAKQQGAGFKELGKIELETLKEQQQTIAKELSKTGNKIADLFEERRKKIADLESQKPKAGLPDVGGAQFQYTQDLNKKIEAEKVRSNAEIERLNKQFSDLTEKKLLKDREVTLKSEQNKTAIVEEQIKNREKNNQDSADRSIEAEKKAILELEKFRLEQAADTAGATKEFGPVAGRVAAAQAEFELRKKIIEKQIEIELTSEKLTASQRQLILEKAAAELVALEVQTGADIIRIRQDFARQGQDEAQAEADRLIQQENDKIQAKIDASKQGFERYQREQDKLATDSRIYAAKQLEEGLITQEQYNAKIEKINLDYDSRILQNKIRFAEDQVAILKAAGFDTLEAETEIAKAKEQLILLGAKKISEAADLEKQAIDGLKDKYRELGDAITNALNNVIVGAFDARKNQIQEQMDLIDQLKAKEIERVTASTDSEEKKAAKIKLIEAKAQNDKEALERRQRQIDARRALFERTFKAFQIGTEGIKSAAAVKVSAAETYARVVATTLNPALAAGLSATVLAQLPIVYATTAANLVGLLATKIPQYWVGTEYSKEGFAWVGEKGRELGIDPSGKKTLYEEPTLTYLARGTKIKPHHVTEDILAAAESDRSRLLQGFSQNITIAGNEELVDSNRKILGELESINKKSRIVIMNQGNIETSAWYLQNMKY